MRSSSVGLGRTPTPDSLDTLAGAGRPTPRPVCQHHAAFGSRWQRRLRCGPARRGLELAVVQVPDERAATRLVSCRPPARRAWRCARVSFAPGSSTALRALSHHAGSSVGLVGSRAALTRTLRSAACAAGSNFGSRCGELRLVERVVRASAGTAATSQPRRRVLSHLALVEVQLRS